MPDRVHGIRIPLGVELSQELLCKRVARSENLPLTSILQVDLIKRSLDARRRRQEPAWILSVDVWVRGEEEELRQAIDERENRRSPSFPTFSVPVRGPVSKEDRPLVVGMGPAGLFAALAFADSGIPCTVLERGAPLGERHVDVRTFRRKGELRPESNLCFGEGGAGTYSDGKLYTRKRHPMVHAVYERLVAFGATDEILTDAHPHIGTNKLYGILEGMRNYLLERGSTVRFHTRVKRLLIENGKTCGVVLDDGEELRGSPVILATGHSARDFYHVLHEQGVQMEPKPFAIGARCEHPQELIDTQQLGPVRQAEGVGAAEYFLSCQVGGRGLYSFCMCPGGFIIPTPTEIGHLNVNGMSNSNRGGKFANAALVVTVEPQDFYLEKPGDLEEHGVLAGIAFQRHWEHRTFLAGGENYCAPAQRLTDLVARTPSSSLPSQTSYRPGLVAGTLDGLLPETVLQTLRQGVPQLDERLPGYFMEEAILVGVETTTSTPVRMVRGDDREAAGLPGLYPTGEGAGYSGGIVSSAMEGIRSAYAAMERYFPVS